MDLNLTNQSCQVSEIVSACTLDVGRKYGVLQLTGVKTKYGDQIKATLEGNIRVWLPQRIVITAEGMVAVNTGMQRVTLELLRIDEVSGKKTPILKFTEK